jgi:hypothetical protein
VSLQHNLNILMSRAVKALANSPVAYGEPMEIVDGINLDKVRMGDSEECWKAADYIKKVNNAR